MRKDILLDPTGDLVMENGDFVINVSDTQHIEHIITLTKGEFKEYPLLGVGAENYLKTNTDPIGFKRDVRVQLEYDGYKNANITLSENYELNITIK